MKPKQRRELYDKFVIIIKTVYKNDKELNDLLNKKYDYHVLNEIMAVLRKRKGIEL